MTPFDADPGYNLMVPLDIVCIAESYGVRLVGAKTQLG
jgi:hypothetical protein